MQRGLEFLDEYYITSIHRPTLCFESFNTGLDAYSHPFYISGREGKTRPVAVRVDLISAQLITVIMVEGEGRRWNKVVGTSSERRRTSYLAYKSRVCVLGEGAYDENNLFKTRSQNYLMALLGAEETLMNFQYSKESYFGINIFVLLE